MERIAEPELMDDPSQAEAYARADFSAPHQMFVELCRDRLGELQDVRNALDLGCGPGDVTVRFARAYPSCQIDGIDGSAAMIDHGHHHVAAAALTNRVRLYCGFLPQAEAPRISYELIISNSLLHHLAQPQVLWQSVKRWGTAGTHLFVMDLRRPESVEQASTLMQQYAANEPQLLRRDFYNSLLAAYRPCEIEEQLRAAGLPSLHIETPTDRHLIVWGTL